MSRVIQDSDDDLDDDLEANVHQPETTDASSKQSTSDASSTEALRRQIEAAHRAHLQSQYSMNDGHSSKQAPQEYQQDGTAPSDFGVENIVARNQGSRDRPIANEEAINGYYGTLLADRLEDQSSVRQVPGPTHTTNELDWMLEGTMRDAYALHNPNAMFPEPSSTVPNATLTQQRVLEGILAPAFLGSDADVSRTPFQPDASIPWSEYLKSPTNTGEQPRSSAHDPRLSQLVPVALSELSQHEPNGHLQSQRSQEGSLMLVDSPSPTLNDVHIQDNAGSSNEANRPTKKILQSIASSASSGVTHEGLQSSRIQLHRKRPSPAPSSDDDLASMKLAKEQYKPRPSRSRSLKTDMQESADHPVESKRTKASRRRTTDATTNLTEVSSTPEKVQQICEMGFTPSTTRRVLKQHNGDVTRTVDWLIANGVADDELASQTTPMSTTNGKEAVKTDRGNRKDGVQGTGDSLEPVMVTCTATESGVANNGLVTTASNTNTPAIDSRSPTKVQVVIPAKHSNADARTLDTPKTSRKEAKRRKTALDHFEPAANEAPMLQAKSEKKRSRGRPKKAVKPLVSSEDVQNVQDEDPHKGLHGSPLHAGDEDVNSTAMPHRLSEYTTTATTVEPKQEKNVSHPVDIPTIATMSRSTPEPPVLPDRPEVSPITPERTKRPASREQISNNKAKVPYRVGLSKRARIAPLLRTMKK